MSEFENASKCALTLNELTNENKLKLYGLYKQALFGNINIEKPNFWKRVDLAKWYAWNDNKNIDKEDAKRKYIELVDEFKNLK